MTSRSNWRPLNESGAGTSSTIWAIAAPSPSCSVCTSAGLLPFHRPAQDALLGLQCLDQHPVFPGVPRDLRSAGGAALKVVDLGLPAGKHHALLAQIIFAVYAAP